MNSEYSQFRTSDLQVALEKYQENNHPTSTMIPVKECSWDDVLEEMSQAVDEYNAKDQGSKNCIRKGLRKVGDYAPAINPWFDLIPDGHGMKTLGAGLKLIFNIAKHQAEYREKILTAFGDFVTILDNTHEKRRIFRTHERLRACSLNVYETVLGAITDLINLLNHRTWKDRAASFIQGPLASREIDEIVSNVNKKLDNFRNCLEDVRDQKLTSVHQAVTSGQSELHAVRLNTKNIEIDVRDLHGNLNEFAAQANFTHSKIENIESGVNQINKKIDQLITHHALEAQTSLYHHLLDTIKAYESQQLMSYKAERPHFQMLQLPQFLEALQVPYMLSTQDLEYVIRQGPNFNAKAQIQAQHLTNYPEFQRWLASRRSDLLLVDGNADPADPNRISPLSVVCATLALSLHKSNSKPLVLHFFCGQHSAATDHLNGPTGLMRSVITQLLYSGRQFNIDFIDSRTYRESLEAHSLRYLCDTFCKLIEQLPLDTNVFCILDGISLYETEFWLDGIVCVFQALNGVATDEQLRPVFKVLLTSPHMSRNLGRRVALSQHVVLQPGAINGRLISERSIGRKLDGVNCRRSHPIMAQGEGESSSDDYEDSCDY
ncbi:uncharacterized protein N7482_009594 [Penicillium canariense]|uniref:Nephrocystin 3-like N-terminal domain-containing protein n=1 Tax=Penicillium canariense TaxID=189055 RepID=A0A9W9HP48_9EURO|nr:uncharacterized protein N7482_009594 [Penicillium canariense]KAJ5153116.1 hypothetical protein N7482_009594 [Penicillium canariense]